MQPVKHNLQNKKIKLPEVCMCPRCSVGAKPALHAPAPGSSPVLAFFPLPTAHCPLPSGPLLTAHLQTADRSGKLGKVESLMSRRQNAASAVNRCVAAHAKVRAHRCPTLRAKVGDRNAHCILPCLLQNNICNRCCGTAKLSISPFLHVLATLASRKKLPRTHQ